MRRPSLQMQDRSEELNLCAAGELLARGEDCAEAAEAGEEYVKRRGATLGNVGSCKSNGVKVTLLAGSAQ